jgi:hypothetical protein
MKLPINYDRATRQERREARLEYVKEQGGKCQYCEEPLDGDPEILTLRERINLSLFPPGFMDNPVHLHHNHNTGMTIGAVHAHCNAVLWQYHGE